MTVIGWKLTSAGGGLLTHIETKWLIANFVDLFEIHICRSCFKSTCKVDQF